MMQRAGIALADESAVPTVAPANYDDLYRTHRPRVLRLCRVMLGNPDDAQDICQEVFLKLHRALRDATTPVRWEAWLTTVTINACRDQRRSRWWRWLRVHETLDDDDIPDSRFTPEQAALSNETRRRIWQAIRALPARQREVFALRQLEGLSTEDTAALLQLSTGSVKQHLFRAIRQLRLALEGSYA